MHDLIANIAVALPLVAVVIGVAVGWRQAKKDDFLRGRFMRRQRPVFVTVFITAFALSFLLFMTVSVELVVFGGALGPAWLQALAPQYVPLEIFSAFDHYAFLGIYAICLAVIGWAFTNLVRDNRLGPYRR